MMREDAAALKIQTSWRGYLERRRYKIFLMGISTFQKIYRDRMKRKSLAHAKTTQRDNEAFKVSQIEIRRRIAQSQRKLEELACLHPSQVRKFMAASELMESGAIVDEEFRSKPEPPESTRRTASEIAMKKQQESAARIIQKNVKAWLYSKPEVRLRLRHAKSKASFSKENRASFQEIIDKRCAQLEKIYSGKSEEHAEELHDRAQAQLTQYYSKESQSNRKNGLQRREALLARFTLDLDIMQTAPTLANLKSEDIDRFRVCRRDVCQRSLVAHQMTLDRLSRPKWQNDLDDLFNYLPEFNHEYLLDGTFDHLDIE